jgi:membrane protein
VLASFLLRIVISASVGGASIYGPLATPIVVLIWLYFLAIAGLIGAALNAAIDDRFPSPDRVAARASGGAYAQETPMTPVRDVLEDRVEHEP